MYTPPTDGKEPEHIAKYLADPIAAVWRGFDRGRNAADDFFGSEPRRTFDPHMWAHIVRYEAGLSLAAEPGPRNWQFRQLRHSGIEVAKDPFIVRAFKAMDGGPQNPGKSHARRDFFQQLGLAIFGGGAENLILYWRVRGGNLEFGLCKPKGLWRYKGQPRLEWRLPLAIDPLEGLTFPETPEEDFDLPLRFDEDDLGGEELSG